MPPAEPDHSAPSAAPDPTSPHGGARGAAASPAKRPVEDLSYEQARDELVAVVAQLEAGGETLEASLQLWERGEALAARCQQWLDGARERLQVARSAPAEPHGRQVTDPAPDGQDDR